MVKQLLHRGILMLAAGLAFSADATAQPMSEAQQHVDRAQATLNNFLRDPEMTCHASRTGDFARAA